MLKKEFIDNIKDGLGNLTLNEVNSIVEKYSVEIDEKIKQGINEEQVISEYGNVDKIIIKILNTKSFTKTNNDFDSLNKTKDAITKSTKVIEEPVDKFIKFLDEKVDNVLFIYLIAILTVIVVGGIYRFIISAVFSSIVRLIASILSLNIAILFGKLLTLILELSYLGIIAFLGYTMYIAIKKSEENKK